MIASFQNQHRQTKLAVLLEKEITSIFPSIANSMLVNWLYKHHKCYAAVSEIWCLCHMLICGHVYVNKTEKQWHYISCS